MYRVEMFFFGGWRLLEDGEFKDMDEAIEFAKDKNTTNIRIIKVVAKPEIRMDVDIK